MEDVDPVAWLHALSQRGDGETRSMSQPVRPFRVRAFVKPGDTARTRFVAVSIVRWAHPMLSACRRGRLGGAGSAKPMRWSFCRTQIRVPPGRRNGSSSPFWSAGSVVKAVDSTATGHRVSTQGGPVRSREGPVMDEDLDRLDREALLAEAKRLRAGIRAHRDSSGHDLCWHHPQLWDLLPEPMDLEVAVPPWPRFLRGCVAYRESLERELPGAPIDDAEHDDG